MIVRFSVENWMSFRDSFTFSMIANRGRQHGDRLPKLGKYNTRILPLAAIDGGDAAGKTDFFKAQKFAKMRVVKGTQPDRHLTLEGFRLNDASIDMTCPLSRHHLTARESPPAIPDFPTTLTHQDWPLTP